MAPSEANHILTKFVHVFCKRQRFTETRGIYIAGEQNKPTLPTRLTPVTSEY